MRRDAQGARLHHEEVAENLTVSGSRGPGGMGFLRDLSYCGAIREGPHPRIETDQSGSSHCGVYKAMRGDSHIPPAGGRWRAASEGGHNRRCRDDGPVVTSRESWYPPPTIRIHTTYGVQGRPGTETRGLREWPREFFFYGRNQGRFSRFLLPWKKFEPFSGISSSIQEEIPVSIAKSPFPTMSNRAKGA